MNLLLSFFFFSATCKKSFDNPIHEKQKKSSPTKDTEAPNHSGSQ